jgi:hypothetical protein
VHCSPAPPIHSDDAYIVHSIRAFNIFDSTDDIFLCMSFRLGRLTPRPPPRSLNRPTGVTKLWNIANPSTGRSFSQNLYFLIERDFGEKLRVADTLLLTRVLYSVKRRTVRKYEERTLSSNTISVGLPKNGMYRWHDRLNKYYYSQI